MMDYQEHTDKDVRLTILKALASENDKRLNETIITHILKSFGHTRSREYVRTQIRKLADLGAVGVTEVGSVLVAQLKQPGLDHVERRTFLEGVLQPSLDS
jgi:hypothetical protein